MASGYEKAACGVDPSTGWGKPSRRESWAMTALALLFSTPFVLGAILSVRGLLGW